MVSEPGHAGLGVGITYSAAVEPLLEGSPQLFDVVEIEPQTLWTRLLDGPPHFRVREEVLAHLAELPGRKLIHSVGTPVGGTMAPDPEQLRLLREMLERFEAPWVSDHLSYNQTPEFATGFFLPPRQTPAGVDAVTASIDKLQQGLGVPIAVETGVNYLCTRSDELPDGAFVAEVVQRADCGLLLDMHNIFTNALNGRQPIDEFLAEIPLDRVWEMHLAGGMELDGFWLDAHSGAIPDPLFAVCESLMPRLPNLAAIVFEIFPSFVPVVGSELVGAQIERLHDLWEMRTSSSARVSTPVAIAPRSEQPSDALPPAAWERALGELVIGRRPANEEASALAEDRGVRLIEGLVHEFRASMVVGVLRLTSRLLMLTLGTDAFRTILRSHWAANPPQLFASAEADAFAAHVESLDLAVPHLLEVLRFEQAVTATLTDDRTRIATFDVDPLTLLRALAAGDLPQEPPAPGRYEIELTPDGPTGATGLDTHEIRAAFPYH